MVSSINLSSVCQPSYQGTSLEKEGGDKANLAVAALAMMETIRNYMSTIPFRLLATSIPKDQCAKVLVFAERTIPVLLKKCFQDGEYAKAFLNAPPFPNCCIRCAPLEDKAMEVYLRLFSTFGGAKRVYEKIYLLGPRRGEIVAYSKPILDHASSLHSRETIYKLFLREVSYARMFPPSPYLLSIEEVVKRKNSSQLKAIESPWCEGRDLFFLMHTAGQTFPIPNALLIARGVALGLAIIHDHKMTHLDIKPRNILLKSGDQGWVPKIADFGQMMKTGFQCAYPISTRPYTAPEQLAVDKRVCPSMDNWSLGIIMLELFHGPSANKFLEACKTSISEKDFTDRTKLPGIRKVWRQIRKEIFLTLNVDTPTDRLISQLLNPISSSRLTAASVAEEIDAILGERR